MVVSDRGSQCCVCSASVSGNPFTMFNQQLVLDKFEKLTKQEKHMSLRRSKGSDSGSKIEELRVVVQRVLIELPHSAAKTPPTNNVKTPAPSSQDTEDRLLSCASCGMCVHACKCVHVSRQTPTVKKKSLAIKDGDCKKKIKLTYKMLSIFIHEEHWSAANMDVYIAYSLETKLHRKVLSKLC